MRTQLITMIIETIFSKRDRKNKPRADMYLPDYVMGTGLALFVIGIGFIIAFAFLHKIWMIIIAAIAVILGVAALMCWKNQMIRIVSEDKFEYTTFFENKYTYRFDEITEIRYNSDSKTVFIGKKKVHIENCAIISDELVRMLKDAEKNCRK